MFAFTFVSLIAYAAPPESTKILSEYAAKLPSMEPTSEAQFRLATWARRRGLNEVADGHLRAAVHIDPKNKQAQKALGRSEWTGVWETADERKLRLAKEMKLQGERVGWRRQLIEAGVERTFKVRAIDEAGIGSLEDFAAQDPDRSLAAVKTLDQSTYGAASVSLVRFAVGSQFPNVRKAAALALRERNPDDFLPALVEYVRPLRTGTTAVLGVGEVWYWQEGSAMFVALPAPLPLQARGDRTGARPVELETRLSDHYASADRIRDNAVVAMKAITGLNIENDFAKWRQAVMRITDQSVEQKQSSPDSFTTTYYRADMVSVGRRAGQFATGRSSCFAAGTIVAAKRGDIPIDQICVGELVLSRNVETGETAYKPVLARTLRGRVPMNKLTIGEESLIVTPGHPIWSPEGGWVKAKNASKNVVFAAEDRALQVAANESTEPAQAYNLVVADFGTYFVGKSHVLVHDNSPIRNAPAKLK